MPLTTFVDGVTSVMASWLNFQDKHTQDVPDSGVAHAASKISNTPAGSIAATDVQAAINELDTEKASTASLASYAPLASPTFTGTPAAPTASSTTDTTQIATTAFVQDTWERPAFYARNTSSQSIPNGTGTPTLVTLNSEEFDTNSCFDAATNYRFTPNVAGYYFVHGRVAWTINGTGARLAYVFKNGSVFANGTAGPGNGSNSVSSEVSCLMYFNGSTDYVDFRVAQDSGGALNINPGTNSQSTYFCGHFVRKA